ncbi:MAG: hypothetical protein A2463_04735 [Candidatus Staskawiczbacteria bacterium RIFOXYC2_FULL_32_10]|nr:MAG: hypothetical protein A2463_04735 [Candidatus Staskawiczbacteria bacterium RIFOXYC2_FULL_32_10]
MANISIDVRKKTIQELINEEIPSGKYWLPSFQRHYVWDSDNITELLDSIVQNYPIGATILWKPSPEVASDIDPTSIPMLDGVPSNTQDRYFVIDGQQRTASLLLLFNNWSIKRGGEIITCDPIAYDPVSNKFMRHRNRGIDCSKIVKAFCLHDVDILSELKSNTTGDDFNKIRSMAQKILEYPIPQYIMETTGEQETTDEENIFSKMAEAFIRINKEGIRIGNVELMLSFMAGTLSGELKSRVVKLCKELENRDIMVQPIMRSVFSNLGLSQTQIAKPKQFKANIAKIKGILKEDLDNRLGVSERSLRLTAEFLEKEFGIHNARLLPSQTALIPLSTYFGKNNFENIDQMPDLDRKNITSWFLLVNLNGHYSSSVDTRLNRDIEIIRNSDSFPFLAMQETMKVRKHIDFEYIQDGLERNVVREANKAFTFILYILLTKNKADDWGGRLIASRNLNELEKHHIFPQEYLKKELELDDVEDPAEVETIVSNLANITFIHKPVNGSVSDAGPIDYLVQFIDRAKLHFIPENKDLWTKEAYNNGLFQDARIRLIFEAAQKYFPDVFIDFDYKENAVNTLKLGKSIKKSKQLIGEQTIEHLDNILGVEPVIVSILNKLKPIDQDIIVNRRKSYISLRKNINFAYFRLKTDKIWLTVKAPHNILVDIVKNHTISGSNGRDGNQYTDIAIENENNLDEVVMAIQEAYKLQK